MARAGLITATLLALAGGTSVSAQDSPIVVEGERESDASAREAARAVVRNSGAIRGDRPIARWRERLCVDVIGIEEPARAMVEQRILDFAEALDLDARGKPGCRTNVSVAFTFDAAQLVETARTRKPRTFREVPSYHEAALFGSEAPVRAWYRTGWRDRMGRAAAGQQLASVSMDEPSWSGMLPNKDDAPITSGSSKSRVQTDGTRVIESAMIVIDRDLAAGYRVDDVADLVALHALAELYPRDTASDPNSVLALFETPAGEPRGGLSQCDWTLLEQLYAMPAARAGRFHRGALVRALAQAPDCAAG
ncbi:hypothetical protein [Qipengyuania flava]|uniref:hypothetical protein n=1 Tax=Qipengyuania flava TaxID=192812 RepID=UPI001C631ACD|nr:hypothetical protein [Qipengyuania flava]QYJ07029.1 hypothetical protein KUV82_13465 [Qipengyuania flava]